MSKLEEIKRSFSIFCKFYGSVSWVAYNEGRDVVCICTDFSVRSLLDCQDWVGSVSDICKKYNVKVTYCDDSVITVSLTDYVVIYSRDCSLPGENMPLVDSAVEKYKLMRESYLKGNYYGSLKYAYNVLHDMMYCVCCCKIEGYGCSTNSLVLLSDDVGLTIPKTFFLDKMIPYIDYIYRVKRYSRPIENIDLVVELSKDEMETLIKDITSFCFGCEEYLFSK